MENLSSIKTENREVDIEDQEIGFADNIDELKPPGKKCGEIFMLMKNLVFICTFCDSRFYKIQHFVEHLKQHLDNTTYNDSRDDALELNDDNDGLEICSPVEEVMEECDLSEETIVTRYASNNQTLTSLIIEKNCSEMNSTLSEDNDNAIDDSILENQPNISDQNERNGDLFCEGFNESFTTKSGIRTLGMLNNVSGNVQIAVYKSTLDIQPKISKRKGRVCKNKNLDLFCEGCNKWFPSKIRIQRHKLSCGPTLEFPQTVEMPKVAQMINNEGDKITPSINVGTVFAEPIVDRSKCRYCHRQFKHISYRIEHERIHTGEKIFKCELCEKSFRTKHLYKNHLMTHKKIRPHKCHLCDQAFSCSVNLTVHIRRHTGEKPYKCQYCDMCFVVSTERKHHERQHTGEKPFQCNECGQCFATGSRLQTHLTKHKGDRKFKCKDCDKSYFTAANLKIHALSHTDERFTCSICDAKFLRKVYLARHMVLHSDIKPHMCSRCGKRFHQRTGLLIHRKTHERGDSVKSKVKSLASKPGSKV